MFDGNLRIQVDRRTAPVGKALASIGVTADILTLSGVLLAIGAAILIGAAHLELGFVFLVFSAIPDLLDGPVAKARGTSSARGAFLDSVSDRVSDLLIALGLSFYFLHTGHIYLSVLPFGIYGAASLISYQRAKAESLGFDAKGGLMERAERVISIAFGLLFSQILVLVLWAVLVLSVITVGQRFVKVWIQASNRDSRTKLRFRQSYRSRHQLSESAFLLKLRSTRLNRENRPTNRIAQLRDRSGARSWFSSKTSD